MNGSAERLACQKNNRLLSARRLGAVLSVSLLAALAGSLDTAGADGMNPDCLRLGYDNAGEKSDQPVNAVSAIITELSKPEVLAGHVAGWVGVSGKVSGNEEWLQIGIEREPNQPVSQIYYEKQLPNRKAQFASLGTISLNHPVKLEVLEETAHPDYWTLYINDYPKVRDIHLPASDSRLTPQINGESYNAGPNYICNRFNYRFDRIRVKYPGEKSVKYLAHPDNVVTSGFGISDLKIDGFVAGSLH